MFSVLINHQHVSNMSTFQHPQYISKIVMPSMIGTKGHALFLGSKCVVLWFKSLMTFDEKNESSRSDLLTGGLFPFHKVELNELKFSMEQISFHK